MCLLGYEMGWGYVSFLGGPSGLRNLETSSGLVWSIFCA